MFVLAQLMIRLTQRARIFRLMSAHSARCLFLVALQIEQHDDETHPPNRATVSLRAPSLRRAATAFEQQVALVWPRNVIEGF